MNEKVLFKFSVDHIRNLPLANMPFVYQFECLFRSFLLSSQMISLEAFISYCVNIREKFCFLQLHSLITYQQKIYLVWLLHDFILLSILIEENRTCIFKLCSTCLTLESIIYWLLFVMYPVFCTCFTIHSLCLYNQSNTIHSKKTF